MGTNAYGMVLAAERLGFTAKAVKGSKDAFFSEFPLSVLRTQLLVYKKNGGNRYGSRRSALMIVSMMPCTALAIKRGLSPHSSPSRSLA